MTSKIKYGIVDFLSDPSVELEVLGQEADIYCFQCNDENDLPNEISELSSVAIGDKITITKRTLNRLTTCKGIIRAGTGFDNIDYISAGKLGIPVVNVPDYGTDDVANHTIALLLSLCRKISVYTDSIRNDPVAGWNIDVSGKMQRLNNLVLGIVGLGRIGTAVALRAKAFGIKVSFYDPYLPDGFDKTYQISRASSIEELVKVSDILTIHTPLTDVTIGMINSDILNKSKQGIILINTARGKIVSLDAVYEGLMSGHISGFAADVLETEPPNPNHPLIKAYMNKEPKIDGHVLITPHIAFYTEESMRELRIKSAIQMLNAAKGIPLKNCINSKYLESPRVPVDSIQNIE